MRLEILRADPAGNITLMVRGAVARADRAGIAAELMHDLRLAPEQVGFLCAPLLGGAGRLEMMGGEFCGNAARAAGLLLARERGCSGEVAVELSGCRAPVCVWADCARGEARAQMPLPLSVEPICLAETNCTLVWMEGIVHAVAPAAAEAKPLLDALERRLAGSAAAFGVMLLDTQSEALHMTPVVRVTATGTTVWESSCGSGTVAVAAALSATLSDGEDAWTLLQPGGTLTVRVRRHAGALTFAEIGGPVRIDPPVWLDW